MKKTYRTIKNMKEYLALSSVSDNNLLSEKFWLISQFEGNTFKALIRQFSKLIEFSRFVEHKI